jgi:hypothetical protein
MGVPEQRRKKTHGASGVALSYTGSYARLPILRQRGNYTRKKPRQASQEKNN